MSLLTTALLYDRYQRARLNVAELGEQLGLSRGAVLNQISAGPSAAPVPPAGTQPATVHPDTWIPVQAALGAYLEQLLTQDRVAQMLMREAGVSVGQVLK